jgi:hypothetical protein
MSCDLKLNPLLQRLRPAEHRRDKAGYDRLDKKAAAIAKFLSD